MAVKMTLAKIRKKRFLISRKKNILKFSFIPESSKKDLTMVKRVLPEVPTKNNNNNATEPLSPPPTYEESEAGNSNSNKNNNNIRKTANPLPAPRNSLLEEAKVDMETSKKKKHHSNKHKNNKDTVSNVIFSS